MKRIAKYLCVLFFSLTFHSIAFPQYYYNQYAVFDGTDDYFAAPSHQELNLDSAFTIECWVLIRDTTGFNKTILSTVNSGNNSGYAFLIKGSSSNPGSAGRLQLNINGTNNSISQTSGTRLTLNNWNHIAVAFKRGGTNISDTIRFYVNGTQVQSFSRLNEPLVNSTDSLRVGSCYLPGNYSNGLNGFIDDIRIYKTRHQPQIISNDRGVVVSLDEISNITLLNNSRYSSLTASWTFNGTGNDNVGTKNNLLARNGASFFNNSFNPSSYRNQSNYYLKLNGAGWLTAPDSNNTSYDLDTVCTLEAWIYPDSVFNSTQTIVSKGNNYKLGIDGTTNKFFFSINSGTKILLSSKLVAKKQWTNIAATYRSADGVMNLFLNGIPDTSTTFTPGNVTTTNDSLYIGKSLTGEFLFGKVDEIRISKFVKSEILIRQFLYTSLDFQNRNSIPQNFNSYGFEGNTLDNITQSKPLIPKGDAFFEWLNSINTAGGGSQAPLIRLSANDTGNLAGFKSEGSFSVRSNSTVRDSILVSNVTGSNVITVVVLMAHTYMDDVDVSLRAPNGVTVNLSTDRGATFNDMLTRFSDIADSGLTDANAPFSMRIRPQSSLSAFTGIPANGYWRLTVTDDNVANVDSGRVYKWGISFESPSYISSSSIATKFELSQNYPNPFNPNTVIPYSLKVNSFVSLKVFNILGKEVAILVNEKQNAGTYNYQLSIINYQLPSGVYFYKLQTENFTDTKRMVLVK